MFSLKIGRHLSRCTAVNRVSYKCPSILPAYRSIANTVIRRPYSDNKNDKFAKLDKYKVFKDDDSSIILDVEEERALLDSQLADEQLDYEETDQFANFNTSRGVSGVYEVEDIVEVLKKNQASNIFVVSVPANVRYVDYIVIASGKSKKHLMSIIEFVHKLYKKKRNPTDRIPKIVNNQPLDWIALDLGNIALHLLTNECRINYDLETIWSVGEEFDSHLNRPTDSLVALLDEHSFSLQNLEPAVFIEKPKTQ